MNHAWADFTLISTIAETLYRVAATVALIVGGGWAYFTYIRGRTFTERLQLEVWGRLMRPTARTTRGATSEAMTMRILVSCTARNIGTRKLTFEADASAVTLKGPVTAKLS